MTDDLLRLAEPADQAEWRNTKPQREALRAKFGGLCAYCGRVIGKVMHADHVEPCFRVVADQWNRPLPAADRYMLKPERNTVANMMPACAPCNLHKGGYRLEDWRAVLQRSADIVRRQTSTFRAGERFGVISVSDVPVVFHFERHIQVTQP